MITQTEVKKAYPGLMEEMQNLADGYLLKQGALTGLQMALSQEYLDEGYIAEKIDRVRKTMDGLEHDMNIVKAIRNGTFEG